VVALCGKSRYNVCGENDKEVRQFGVYNIRRVRDPTRKRGSAQPVPSPWSRSREARFKRRKYRVHIQTSGKKAKVKRQAVKAWLREHMHTPLPTMMGTLNRKLQGHVNYYGISGNYKELSDFYEICERSVETVYSTISKWLKIYP
jgi:hypothetical protein